MTSKDGIFSQEEKIGVNFASGLSNDALDIYKRANMGDTQSVASNRDSEMLQPDGEDERLEASQRGDILMRNIIDPFADFKISETTEPAAQSLSGIFFTGLSGQESANRGAFDMFSSAKDANSFG